MIFHGPFRAARSGTETGSVEKEAGEKNGEAGQRGSR